jgi:hypothetical protein
LSPEQTNLLQGTLDMVILKALRLGEMHHWASLAGLSRYRKARSS